MEDMKMQVDGDEEVHGLDFIDEDRVVDLICTDGCIVPCPTSMLAKIPFFKDVQECDTEVEEIKVQNISMYIMNDILEWVKHDMVNAIKDLPMPLPSNFSMAQYAGAWVADFLDSRSVWRLFKEIAQAANYLQLAILANYCCAEVSIRLKEPKTPEEFMNVIDTDGQFTRAGWSADDFTPERMEPMRKEWETFLEGPQKGEEGKAEENTLSQ